jgi:cardiolipin synthase
MWALLPNCLSLLRIVLVIPVVLTLLAHDYVLALILFGIAGISDGLDGWLAKRLGWQSRLGSLLDPLADKTLMVATYLALAVTQMLPLWIVVLVIARDAILVVGGLLYHWLIGLFDVHPTLISKLNTTLQICFALLVVFQAATALVPVKVLAVLLAAVAVTTCLSGLDYIRTWGQNALAAKHRAHQ